MTMKHCKPSSTGLSKRAHEVLTALDGGQRYQGTDLAKALGISRAAVWKHIEALRSFGLEIEADGKGYRLARPIEWLNPEGIGAGLDRDGLVPEILFLTESTNACIKPENGLPQVILAEGQRAGRGRRGRDWISPPGSGIYLSLGWRFEHGLSALAPLGLVAGIAAAHALKARGVSGVGVKWPNDLLAANRKLGGCLIDISGTTDGPCNAVFGIGINVDLGPGPNIDQPWTDLCRHGARVSRNDLAIDLINSLIDHIEIFEKHGFDALMTSWRELDELAGRKVRVLKPLGETVEGQADGVDDQGRLRLLGNDGTSLISSGEVSVRAV